MRLDQNLVVKTHPYLAAIDSLTLKIIVVDVLTLDHSSLKLKK